MVDCSSLVEPVMTKATWPGGLIPTRVQLVHRVPPSDVVDGETSVGGSGQSLDVGAVRGDHCVVTAQGTLYDGSVDGVVHIAAGDEHADRARLGLAKWFGPAALEEPGEVVLRAAAPRLGQHARRDGRCDPSDERRTV